MSDEEQIGDEGEHSSTRMLTAEYKDGKLQILQMTPYQRSAMIETGEIEEAQGHGSGSEEGQYLQVLDQDKNVVVDLVNLTLVRCGDGDQTYRLVAHGDDTVTCLLTEDDGQEDQEAYVVVEGSSDQGPLVFLQSAEIEPETKAVAPKQEQKPTISPAEILERAKALQKAKMRQLNNLVNPNSGPPTRLPRGPRGSSLPPPHELLATPGFKLFLYSCKLCSFKCNAIKDLTKHKAAEHGGGVGKWRGRAAASSMQCARCPFRANTHSQLIRHVKDRHLGSGSEF